jgi:hypothetical protein
LIPNHWTSKNKSHNLWVEHVIWCWKLFSRVTILPFYDLFYWSLYVGVMSLQNYRTHNFAKLGIFNTFGIIKTFCHFNASFLIANHKVY